MRELERFASEVWAQRPAMVSNLFTAPLSQSLVFDAPVAAAAAMARGEQAELRAFVGQRLLVADRQHLMPQRSDRSIDDYTGRCRATIDEDFCVVLRNAHMHADPLWAWMRQAFAPLYDLIGTPETTVNSVFVGDYRVTPFGVHIDRDHTFYLPVRGRRRLLLWPPDYPRSRGLDWHLLGEAGTTRFGPHEAAATVLEVEPGQAAYWPLGWWHVAVAEPGPAAALSVGIPAPGVPLVMACLHEGVSAVSSTRMHPAADSIPPSVERQLRVIERTAPSLREQVEVEWLRRRRALGFHSLPTVERPSVTSDDVVTSDRANFEIVDLGHHLVCTRDGRCLALPPHATVLGLVQLLWQGGRWPVAELHVSFGDTMEPDALTWIVASLVALRAIELKAPSTAC